MRFRSFLLLAALIVCLPLLSNGLAATSEKLSNEEQIEKMRQLSGLTRFTGSPLEIKIAKMLLRFRNSQMSHADSLDFYKGMADLGVGMQSIIGTKTKLEQCAIDKKWVRNDFLGESYAGGGTTVEKALLTYRRQLTVDAIKQVAREFKGRQTKQSVYLAEIGKWASQADDALKRSGLGT